MSHALGPATLRRGWNGGCLESVHGGKLCAPGRSGSALAKCREVLQEGQNVQDADVGPARPGQEVCLNLAPWTPFWDPSTWACPSLPARIVSTWTPAQTCPARVTPALSKCGLTCQVASSGALLGFHSPISSKRWCQHPSLPCSVNPSSETLS